MESQTGSLGAFRSHKLGEQSVLVGWAGSQIQISVLDPRIFRVRMAAGGEFSPRRSWAVTPPDSDFPAVPYQVTEDQESLRFTTSLASVQIDKDSCRLSFYNAQGARFCADRPPLVWDPSVPDRPGLTVSKRIEAGEHFFGFGERTGGLDKTGGAFTNWATDPRPGFGPGTDPLYIAIPVFLSIRPGLAYGVFLNNTFRSRFDMGQASRQAWAMQVEEGELDYYVFYGPAPDAVMEAIGKVLGRMPLPPRWALGYHQSRWGYTSQEEVRSVAAEFRRREIPCDAIHLDIDHMDGYRVFTWDPVHFPEPRQLVADLRKDGFHVVTIVDPGVKADPEYTVYREGLERSAFLRRAGGELYQAYVWPDRSVFPDFTQAAVREWWGEQIKGRVADGVAGIWNDMNEPTTFSRPFSQGGGEIGTIDLDAVQGPAGEQTTHAEVHNLYAALMDKATYEGLDHHLGGERPFVLTRSAFAGIQRWSACWTGDNHAWWEHLEMSMPQLMNLSLSGVPFVGADIGGFAGNASPELFARWMQLGSLTPFCRGHSACDTLACEPWAFDEPTEKICREALQLRYRLLPYLYSLFWEAAQRGSPVMRPLFYHFPDDPETYSLHDQFLLGPFLLAAPVYQPGRRHRAVYLPKGEWFDWWSGEKVTGPAAILAQAPLERMPLYVRGGAIVPSGQPVEHAGQAGLDPLILDVFPGIGDFTLYEDDGHTTRYRQGEFSTTALRQSQVPHGFRLEVGKRQGAYSPPPRSIEIRLHGVQSIGIEGISRPETKRTGSLSTIRYSDNGQPATIDIDPGLTRPFREAGAGWTIFKGSTRARQMHTTG